MATQSDVIILGAGAAGLEAARAISASGLSVILLEARPRVGGRIHTIHDESLAVPIELGAEFIHGVPPETWDIVRQLALPVVEISGSFWRYTGQRLALADGFRENWEKVVRRMTAYRSDDMSFYDFAQRCCRSKGWQKIMNEAIAYVEGFHAAHIDRISLASLLEAERGASAIEGERQFRVASGYDGVVTALRGGIDPRRTELHLNTIVRTVRWKKGSVEVSAVSGAMGRPRAFKARCAVITLPLGVLKAPRGTPGAVEFTPHIEQKERAVKSLDVVRVVKVVLRFRDLFWEHGRMRGLPDGSPLSFIISRDEWMPTWWSSYPVHAPVLTGWAGGSAADRLAAVQGPLLASRALGALARILGVKEGSLEEQADGWYTHDWQADVFSRGAYSYVPVGGLPAQRALAEPVAGTLFFAGEATNLEGHSGTVHGAVSTGARAAREIVRIFYPRGTSRVKRRVTDAPQDRPLP